MMAFLTRWWRTIAIAFAVAVLAFILGRCDGTRSERARNDAARAEANIEALKRDGKAAAVAASEQLTDAATVNQNERDLIDAIQSAPDTAPDAVRVAAGCERLRKQGTDITAIPACR